MNAPRLTLLAISIYATNMAIAGGIPTLSTIEVTASADNLIGEANTATQGVVTAEQLSTRPLLRPAEVLEIVPGLIVTQHSGDGKANQYFLRGFNLDHGTDFATSVAGMPINMPTHGHGQGYSDLNFMIPELIETVQYRKGSYAAEDGDFASAGAADIHYFWQLPQNITDLTMGENNYFRGLVAGSKKLEHDRSMLFALEWHTNDGPWQLSEDLEKRNGVWSFSQGNKKNGWNISAMAYDAQWQATDQIPLHSIELGQISRFGSLDSSDGGDSSRYSLSWDWRQQDNNGQRHINAYAIDYSLNLFSNFSYFLTDPVNGDQFHQQDQRRVYGFDSKQTWFHTLGNYSSESSLGLEARYDDIDNVGLSLTNRRQLLTSIRKDSVKQSLIGLYGENQTQWQEKFRSIAGLRADFYHADINANLAANSGSHQDHILSPKLSLIFGPWQQTEYYANYGYGFHSNDARGTTTHINPDPRDANFLMATDTVPALVRTKGGELGVRSAAFINGLQSTLALWQLDSDSELVFVGDAGTTEANRPSHRYGVEMTHYYRPLDWLVVDADVAISKAKFRDVAPEGQYIPGAIDKTASLGVAITQWHNWSAGLRLRYLGSRPLIEDNSIRSASSTLTNAKISYQLTPSWQTSIEVLNVFDKAVNDIEYFYGSCTAADSSDSRCDPNNAEREGIEDRHIHPAEPRTVRFTLRGTW